MNETRSVSPATSPSSNVTMPSGALLETLENVRVREADEREKIERDLVCHEAWGGGLTREQFVARESRLRSLPWSRGGMKTWVLLDTNDTVLASCETFRMKSAIRTDRGANAIEGETFGIASVFVETAFRKRGYAERLVSSVVSTVKNVDKAQAMILFSEVGTTLYARSGFVPMRRRAITLDALPGEPSKVVDGLLTEAAVLDLTDAIAWPDRAGVFVLPTSAQLDWHLDRERFYTSLMRRPRPLWAGARVGQAWVNWVYSPRNATLIVLGIHGAGRDDELVALIECARRIATSCGATRVELWGEDIPSADLASALVATSAPPVDPYDTIPMILPLDRAVDVTSWVPSRSIWV